MKALKDFKLSRPIDHELCPSAQTGFVVGARGVRAIECDEDGVVVTLVPGDGSERTKSNPPVRLLVNAYGAGVILEAPAGPAVQKAKR